MHNFVGFGTDVSPSNSENVRLHVHVFQFRFYMAEEVCTLNMVVRLYSDKIRLKNNST